MVDRIVDEEGFVPVTFLHRDDIASRLDDALDLGEERSRLIASLIEDDELVAIAESMESSSSDFWTAMDNSQYCKEVLKEHLEEYFEGEELPAILDQFERNWR